jgi:hypothetical protein
VWWFRLRPGPPPDPDALSPLNMVKGKTWKHWLVRGVLLVWGLQVIWLGFHFAPEMRDLALRVAQGKVGAAIRQEDPLYPWFMSLAGLMPEKAAYVFLDNYEAGKEIEARYFLAPRRHILLPPEVPADFLFYVLHRQKATFLLLRDRQQPLGPGARAALRSPAFHPVDLPGPGAAWRVNPEALQWGFYD